MFKDQRPIATEFLEDAKSDIIHGKFVDTKKYTRMILQKVSRTYALTIQSLGQPFREPILVGYLFCRIADTYEDSDKLDTPSKVKALETYAKLFESEGTDTELLKSLKASVAVFSTEDDEEFLSMYPELCFQRYREFGSPVKEIIKRTVLEMVEGMISTVKKQYADPTIGTDSIKDLERYCYYVAGTVGNMLTDLFYLYSPWINKKVYDKLSKNKIAFGEALQLTNIIKDAMGDLKRGVSFIPKDLATEYGVDLKHLYKQEYREQASKVIDKLILKATEDLNKAFIYCLNIPKREPRMRLFTLMPVFFAIKTLGRAMENYDELLNPDGNVKISRDDVKKTLRFIIVNCLWDYKLVVAYQEDLAKIEKQLNCSIPLKLKKLPFVPIVLT